jgi:predicted nucleic acid-binding protein
MTARYVVDASAVLTLVLDPSERGGSVARLIVDADLHAPDLLPHEITNVLRRRRLAGALSPTEASLARSGALRLPVELWPHAAVADRVWGLADTLTAYDAAYVALAERLGVALLTADIRLSRAPGPTCEIVTV